MALSTLVLPPVPSLRVLPSQLPPNQGSSEGGEEMSAGDIGVSGPSSPQGHPLHKHPGSSKPLCPREGSHVASQVLHRGLEYSDFCIYFFLLLFHFFHFSSLLPLFLPLNLSSSIFPREFPFSSLLKVPTVSLNPPFLSSWAILEFWMKGAKERR